MRRFVLPLVFSVACSSPPPATTIGPAGGTVDVGDVTLSVPAGALSTDVAIRITRTDDAPPPGYVAYSSTWQFEPTGIRFAVPATVSIAFTGDASRARLLWSDDRVAFAERPTTISGGRASAAIDHFSFGAVGALAELDGGEDAGDLDAPPIDAPPVDGATACGAVVDVPPAETTALDPELGGWSSEMVTAPIVTPCFTCSPFAGATTFLFTRTIRTTAPMELTLFDRSCLTVCGPHEFGASDCGSGVCSGTGRSLSTLLAPGVHQLYACELMGSPRLFSAEIAPPPPPLENTTCAAAREFPSEVPGPTPEPRVFDDVPRWYHLPRGTTAMCGDVGIATATQPAEVSFEIRQGACPGTLVTSGSITIDGSSAGRFLANVSRGAGEDYYLVLTSLTRGMKYTLQYGSTLPCP